MSEFIQPALNNTTARGSTMVGRAVNGAEHVQLAGAPQLAPGDVLNPASNPLPMPSVAKPLLGGLSLPSSLAPDLVAQAIQSNRASQEAFSAALAASKENSPTINSLSSAAAALPLPPGNPLMPPLAPAPMAISPLQPAATTMNAASPVLAPANPAGKLERNGWACT